MAAGVTKESLIADLVSAWRINERVNEYLIDELTDEAWNAKPPGGKGRTIAAIFAHIHNVRVMWLKTAAKNLPLPAKADPDSFDRAHAKIALGESAAAIASLLEQGFLTGRISGFPPSAAAFLGYMLAHDAHHRGQVTMLARQLGHAISQAAGFGVWEWNSRANEVGR